MRSWSLTRGRKSRIRGTTPKVSSALADVCVREGTAPGRFERLPSSAVCSVQGQPSPGGPRALRGLRRPHGVPRQQRRGREFPPSAEAPGLLPAAAHPQRKDQRSGPGEGGSPPPGGARR